MFAQAVAAHGFSLGGPWFYPDVFARMVVITFISCLRTKATLLMNHPRRSTLVLQAAVPGCHKRDYSKVGGGRYFQSNEKSLESHQRAILTRFYSPSFQNLKVSDTSELTSTFCGAFPNSTIDSSVVHLSLGDRPRLYPLWEN